MPLNYAHLRYFRAVARDGNLTRAAARLNVSQSALSVQIRALEARLAHALFERRGRRLFLTEAGRVALDHADAIFAMGEELVRTLGQIDRPRQALRIGALATLSRNLQLGFLKPVLGREDVEVVLRSGNAAELLAALIALDLDIVLTNHAPATDALTPYAVHRLAEQQVSLIGAPDLAGGGEDAAALISARALIVPTLGSAVRAAFDAFAARADIRPRFAAEVDDMAMMRLLAREGAGLAVLPPIVVRDELESGALVEAAPLPGITETFYAVTVERRTPNPLLRELLTPAR